MTLLLRQLKEYMLCVETETYRESEAILEIQRRSQGSLDLIFCNGW